MAEPSRLGVGDSHANAGGGGGSATGDLFGGRDGQRKGVRVHAKKTAGGKLGNACYG